MFKKRREGGSISEFAPMSLSSVYYHFNKSLSLSCKNKKEGKERKWKKYIRLIHLNYFGIISIPCLRIYDFLLPTTAEPKLSYLAFEAFHKPCAHTQ